MVAEIANGRNSAVHSGKDAGGSNPGQKSKEELVLAGRRKLEEFRKKKAAEKAAVATKKKQSATSKVTPADVSMDTSNPPLPVETHTTNLPHNHVDSQPEPTISQAESTNRYQESANKLENEATVSIQESVSEPTVKEIVVQSDVTVVPDASEPVRISSSRLFGHLSRDNRANDSEISNEIENGHHHMDEIDVERKSEKTLESVIPEVTESASEILPTDFSLYPSEEATVEAEDFFDSMSNKTDRSGVHDEVYVQSGGSVPSSYDSRVNGLVLPAVANVSSTAAEEAKDGADPLCGDSVHSPLPSDEMIQINGSSTQAKEEAFGKMVESASANSWILRDSTPSFSRDLDHRIPEEMKEEETKVEEIEAEEMDLPKKGKDMLPSVVDAHLLQGRSISGVEELPDPESSEASARRLDEGDSDSMRRPNSFSSSIFNFKSSSSNPIHVPPAPTPLTFPNGDANSKEEAETNNPSLFQFKNLEAVEKESSSFSPVIAPAAEKLPEASRKFPFEEFDFKSSSTEPLFSKPPLTSFSPQNFPLFAPSRFSNPSISENRKEAPVVSIENKEKDSKNKAYHPFLPMKSDNINSFGNSKALDLFPMKADSKMRESTSAHELFPSKQKKELNFLSAKQTHVPESSNDEFSALEQHIEDLTQEKFSLQRGLEAARSLAESLAQENSSLMEDFNHQGGVLSHLKEDIERLTSEIKAQQLVVASSRAERDRAADEKSSAVERSQALAAEVIALEEKVLRLRSQEIRLQHAVEQLTEETGSQKKTVASLLKEKAQLRASIAALQQEKRALQLKLRKAMVGGALQDEMRSGGGGTLVTAGDLGLADASTSTDDLEPEPPSPHPPSSEVSPNVSRSTEQDSNTPLPISAEEPQERELEDGEENEEAEEERAESQPRSTAETSPAPPQDEPPPSVPQTDPELNTFPGTDAVPWNGAPSLAPSSSLQRVTSAVSAAMAAASAAASGSASLGLRQLEMADWPGSLLGELPAEEQQTVDSIHALLGELLEEKRAMEKALDAEASAAAELRAANAELSRKLASQTQRLELSIAQKMAAGETVDLPEISQDISLSHAMPEYVDEGDEVAERVLNWILRLFPGGNKPSLKTH